MRKRRLLYLALISIGACGGGARSSGSTPTGDDLEATPVETGVGAEAETETDGADGVCPQLCDRRMACVGEVSGQEPTEEQLAQAKEQCGARCVAQDADDLEVAGKCMADNPDSCPGLIECLQAVQSGS